MTDKGAEVTLDALSIGAVDYLPKPKIDLAATLADYKEELIAKVKAAASARGKRSVNRPAASNNAITASRSRSDLAPDTPPASALRRQA